MLAFSQLYLLFNLLGASPLSHSALISTRSQSREHIATGGCIIEVLVDAPPLKPRATLVILPSYGRDGGPDYDTFTTSIVAEGYLVLRPQPLGTYSSTGPMQHMTLELLSLQIREVIWVLAPGRAIILGHAFGNYIARITAKFHPEVVSGVILAAAQGLFVPKEISVTPFTAANPALSQEERLAALRLGFFAPIHSMLAMEWLNGWYPNTLAMQSRAVHMPGGLKKEDFWDLGGKTKVLEIIAAQDPFKTPAQWSQMRDLLGKLCTTVVISNASHALFPEQSEQVARKVLEWMGDVSKGIDVMVNSTDGGLLD